MDDLPGHLSDFIEPEPNSGCWLWIGNISTGGYGRSCVGRPQRAAHRVVYALLIGEIRAGLTLDHLCRVRCCVNPRHLEPVTNRENILRGAGFAAKHARKTLCPRGHAYDAANTHVYRGMRFCKTCHRDQQRERYARRLSETRVQSARR